MKHLINSLKFDLHCPQEAQAFELRHEVMQHLQPLLVQGLENVCDARLAPDDWVRIDKLEIDLGRISIDTLKEQFGPQFRDRFEHKLLEYLSKAPEAHDDVQQHTLLQLFFSFMQTGRLPWWGEAHDFEACCQHVITQEQERVIEFFLEHKQDQNLWERVIKQLDHRFWQLLLSSIPAFKEAREQLVLIAGVFRANLQQAMHPAAPAIRDELQKLEQDDRVLLLTNATDILRAQSKQAIKEVMAGILVRTLFPVENTERGELAAQIRKSVAGEFKWPQEGERKAAEAATLTPEKDFENSGPEKIMIHDAGLVLLGPYLKPFFSALGLWKDQQWVSEEGQERAACLLRFIATGEKADKEYNLVLEKLLCGIPLYQPIYTDYEFTAVELGEAEDLLTSVIAHWEALKNTSVAAFRSSFLLREAVLSRKDQDWQITVEKKTLDVLLESIPWGYGALCLSWNEYLIFTEW